MAGIHGKQLRSGTVAASKLSFTPVEDGNLSWRAPVAVLHLVGNATVATINGLSPATGDAYVVTNSGTLTAGSLSVVAGDVVEYDGSIWVKIVSGSGGFVPSGTRLVLATQTALISPYTDVTDDAKIVSFTGASNTGSPTNERIDGYAIIVNGDGSVHENKGYVYSGSSVSWVAFGAGSITDGAGLQFSGTTLNIGDAGKGVQVNANDIQVDASEVASSTGGLQQVPGGGNEHLLQIKLDTTTGGGVSGLARDTNGLRIDTAAAGSGLAGGGGSALSIATSGENVTFTTSIWTFPADSLQVTGTPDSANDAVNKAYVDNVSSGTTWKEPVAVRGLIGNVVTEGLVGNATVATINGLSPAAGDAYVVTDSGTLTAGSLSVDAGDLVEYSGSAWVKLVAQSGGFVPNNTTALLSMSTALITPYTDATDDGKIAKFGGASNTATLTTQVAGDAVVISAPGTAGVDQGDLKEYSGSAWVEIVAGVGGFVPIGTRVILSEQSLLVSPYVEATDNDKVLEFDGASNTGANTSEAVNGNALLVNGQGSYYEGIGYAYDGTVPGGVWNQFTGAGQINAGAGLTKNGNTLDVGDANRGVQVNANNLEIDASEIAGTGLEAGASSWLLRIAASAAGNGLTGGGGSALAVQALNDSVRVTGSGVEAAVPSTVNKSMTASVTASDNDQATATTVAAAPVTGGWVTLLVNGIKETVGNGTKTGVSAYISGDSGTTARSWDDVVSGDTIHWNGSVATYELDANDVLDLVFTDAAV